MFKLKSKSNTSAASRGELKSAHGSIQTPFFMPIATQAAVKTLSNTDNAVINPQILLSNTYPLMLRPGMEIMEKAQGLHNLMSWEGPILTDSGGFQVFYLSNLRKITEEGASF